MFSIICPCSDRNTFDRLLGASLQKQSCKNYELVILDAKEHGFTSAAETLNYGAEISRGDILLFVHQDVQFLSENWLDQLERYCGLYDFGIAGVAGSCLLTRSVFSSVKHGIQRSNAGAENSCVRGD